MRSIRQIKTCLTLVYLPNQYLTMVVKTYDPRLKESHYLISMDSKGKKDAYKAVLKQFNVIITANILRRALFLNDLFGTGFARYSPIHHLILLIN